MKTYSSPSEVFDAYRQAHRSGDWRTFYFLFTPEVQRDMVFEAYFACGVSNRPNLEAVQEKFGASEAEFGKRYFEQYKQKHGHAEVIDRFLAKAVPYWESKDKGADGAKTGRAGTTQPPEEAAVVDALPKDEELTRKAFHDATKDKVGFFAAVYEILEKDRKPNTVGNLEQVVLHGDTATGRAKMTIAPTPGESPPEVDKIDKDFRFRKVNGNWLLDSL